MKKITHYLIDHTPKTVKKIVPGFIKKRVAPATHEWTGSSVSDREERKVCFSNKLPQDISKQKLNQYIHPGSSPEEPVEGIDFDDYCKKWDELFGQRSEDYFKMHKLRYYELLNGFDCYIKGKEKPLVLEIGVSEFAVFYKYYFPGIRLVTLDRPKELNGFEADYCINTAGAERHYHIDLNKEKLSPGYGDPPLGKFDYIICTEVLEHLIVNPVGFLTDLLGILKPDGFLYLTTPNFFRYDNINKISNGVNPQMVYPGVEKNKDAHHHFREYEMNELLQFTAEAGGGIVENYFSGCWDNPELLEGILKDHPGQKSNLVFLIKHQSS